MKRGTPIKIITWPEFDSYYEVQAEKYHTLQETGLTVPGETSARAQVDWIIGLRDQPGPNQSPENPSSTQAILTANESRSCQGLRTAGQR